MVKAFTVPVQPCGLFGQEDKRMQIKIRDLRKKDQYKIDDAYLNGYARLCGVYATAVYNSLSRHADFQTQECFPSIETIAEQHNMSRPSVIKAIKILESWGIIIVQKEKDEVTKRQKNNVYLLADKSTWKPKPSKPSLPRAESISDNDPSKRQNKSRVNDVDCKDTHTKDTHIRIPQTIATSSPVITEVFHIFQEINPTINYGNPFQRRAVEELVKRFGEEKTKGYARAAVAVHGKKYAPTITNPSKLKEKLSELGAYYKRQKDTTSSKVGFIE